MVLQDTWLFGGTIAENIAYGKPNATREEIVRAAQMAKVDYFIRTMPNGYDTVLDNDAGNLSVGQRQLLTIARVFLCNPPVRVSTRRPRPSIRARKRRSARRCRS